MMNTTKSTENLLQQTLDPISRSISAFDHRLEPREIGTIISIGDGIAHVSGLPNAKAEELIRFPGDILGMVFNLDPDVVGIVMLDEHDQIEAGQQVYRTGRVLDVPVGEGALGRMMDPVGRPLDERGPIHSEERRPIERDAPPIMHRAPVKKPLQTGIKVIDALLPIGRGQRELILGDRQTGKTAIAIDTIINQKDKGVWCIYCGVGKQKADLARVIADLKQYDAMDYTTVVAAPGDMPPGLQFVAPYAATALGEFFMEQGHDVLIIYDDLTWHARAYRELSLLLRRPPGREAYPGDIFYIHSRLLERATHLRSDFGGGSLTALPIVETQAQNLSAYIPTNLISITDGQIYLSPHLFQKDILPAVDVGKSVSRVGGKAQLPAYRAVSGRLRLSYSQFQELEAFSKFSTRLDEETRQTIDRGQRVREILKQNQYDNIPVFEQIAIMIAVSSGLLDQLDLNQLEDAEVAIRSEIAERQPELRKRVMDGNELGEHDIAAIHNAIDAIIKEAFKPKQEESHHAQS
jgi:F-type H+-transporting ATPase subunit alpha